MTLNGYSTAQPDFFDTDGTVGPLVFDLRFDWPNPPLTANQRMHHMMLANITRQIRTAAAWTAKRIPALGRCDVTLTWHVTDHRRRDADNIVPTLKALCDGLVDAGVVTDDTPDLMVKHMPVILFDPTEKAHLMLRVAQLEPEAKAA